MCVCVCVYHDPSSDLPLLQSNFQVFLGLFQTIIDITVSFMFHNVFVTEV